MDTPTTFRHKTQKVMTIMSTILSFPLIIVIVAIVWLLSRASSSDKVDEWEREREREMEEASKDTNFN